jgi:hypothetical protein
MLAKEIRRMQAEQSQAPAGDTGMYDENTYGGGISGSAPTGTGEQTATGRPTFSEEIERHQSELSQDLQGLREDERLNAPSRFVGQIGEVAQYGGQALNEAVFEPALRAVGFGLEQTVGRMPAGFGAEGSVAENVKQELPEVGAGIMDSELGQMGMAALQEGGEIWQGFKEEHPNIATVIEGSAKTALFGAEITPFAQVGGKVAKATPSVLGAKKATDVIKGQLFPYTKEGGRVRALEELQSRMADPDASIKAMRESFDSDSPLTPAQAAGDPDLLDLEATIAARDPAALKARQEQMAGARQQLLDEAMPEGDVRAAREYVEGRVGKITGDIENLRSQAENNARLKISQLEPNQRASQASAIVQQEIKKALDEAKLVENDLWSKIPKTSWSPEGAKRKYLALKNSLSEAEQGLIPKVARDYLDPDSKTVFKGTKRAQEYQGLRSVLLNESRKAAASGDFAKARISNKLADDLLEELGAQSQRETGPAGKALREALDYSRELNQKFRADTPSKILGRKAQGQAKVAPEMALEATVGAGKGRGNVAIGELLRASDTPEVRQGITDYMLNVLDRTANKPTGFNVNTAAKFLEDNKDIIDRFPGIRQNVEAAVDAKLKADRMTAREGAMGRALTQKQSGATSRLLNAQVGQEISSLFMSQNPQMAARDLMKLVRRDKDAVAGVRAAAAENILTKARVGAGDVKGKNILNILNDKKQRKVYSEILGVQGMRRLESIGKQISKLDAAEAAKNTGVVMKKPPNKLVTMFTRRQAAIFSGKITTGPASLQQAQMFSGRAKELTENLTNDMADKMLAQAMVDKEAFDILMMPVETKKQAEKASKKINAWLAGPGAVVFVRPLTFIFTFM